LAPGIRASVRAGWAADGEFRRLAIGFLLVRGFDRVLHRDGEAGLVAALDELAMRLEAVAVEYGAQCANVDIAPDGTKVTLTTGLPHGTEDDVSRLLQAATELARCDRAFAGLRLAAGVNSARLFVGDVGHPRRRALTIMGDGINLAARLAGLARPGTVIASSDTVERAPRFIASRSSVVRVKGRRAPVEIGVVRPRRQRVESHSKRRELPLIGRDHERARVIGALDALITGRGGVIEVVGDPGAGKTRLVADALAVARRRGLPVSLIEADRYASTVPFGAVRPLVDSLLGERVAAAPDADRSEFFSNIVARLRESAGRSVVAVEDLQWLDPSSAELLTAMARAAKTAPWLVVATTRPRPNISLPGADVIALAPLAALEAERLALAAAGGRLTGPALDGIVRAASGNPLFLVELAPAVAAGAVTELPDAVERLIASQLGTVAPADRALLQEASVFGANVDVSVLAAVIDDSTVTRRNRWRGLGEFVTWSADSGIRFTHDLVRAAAYESMSFRHRQRLHARAVAVLADRGAEPALLALHASAAGIDREAWRWSKRAGLDARRDHALDEAAGHLGRALAAGVRCGAPAAQLAETGEALGDVTERLGDPDAAASAYRDALRHIGEDDVGAARLLEKLGVIAQREGRYGASLQWFARATKRLGQSSEVEGQRLRIRLLLDRGGTRHYQGRFDEAVALADQAVVAAAALGDRALEALAHLQREMTFGAMRDARSEEAFQAAEKLYARLDDPVGFGTLLSNAGVTAYDDGRWDVAVERYSRAIDAFAEGGHAIGRANVRNNLAMVLADRGQWQEAASELERALGELEAASFPFGVVNVAMNLGRVDAWLGRRRQCEARFEKAAAMIAELGLTSLEPELLLYRAEAAVRFGDALWALDQLDGAAAAADGLELMRERVRGSALVLSGERDKGRAVIIDALDQAAEPGSEHERLRLLQVLALIDGPALDAALRSERRALTRRLNVRRLPPVWPRSAALPSRR
jgi:class 3 adenylate cyclase/tetratricopeptide (TPR) repeat protein